MTSVRTIPLSLSFVLALSASACSHAQDDFALEADDPEPADAPAELGLAHEAYLVGDFVEMGDRLREVIANPRTGELARDNAFALLESAYEATHGELPARFTLPKAVQVMTLGVLNGAHPFGAHRAIYLDMHLVEGRAAHVRDIRVTRLPSEPILSLAGGLGTFHVEPAANGVEDVKLELRDVDVLPDDGAFAIAVEFDDAPAIDAFVLADKLVASTLPEVTSPQAASVLDDPQPEIAWRPFRSPQFASWEKRALYVGVSGGPDIVWQFYEWQPGERSGVRVGESGTGAARLEAGAYWMQVMCSEKRMFGGIHVSRDAVTARPFSVVR
jgi:hypothetical protein